MFTLFTTVLILTEYTVLSEVVKVGVILPRNETYPFSLQKIVPALQLAIDNAKSISNYDMELVIRDSQCSETEGPLSAVDLYTEKNAHVFFGPACDFALAPVARYSPSWGIPVLTAGGMASAFSDKSQYKLLTRLLGSYTKVGEFVSQIMKVFNWKDVGLVYSDSKRDPDRGKPNCFFIMEAIYTTIKHTYSVKLWDISVKSNRSSMGVKQLLSEARKKARVLLLCTAEDQVREIVMHAYDNHAEDDFVFFNIDLFGSHSEMDQSWYRSEDTPERNEKARKAYESLMIVTFRTPRSNEYNTFTYLVKQRSQQMYSDTDGYFEMTPYVGAFHDALLLYAIALRDTGDVHDGAAITRRMWNTSFEGITGTVSIDENGDRNMDLSLLDLNPTTGKFEVVADYYGNRKVYTPVTAKSIHFPERRNSTSSDVTPCGTDGAECPSGGSRLTSKGDYSFLAYVLAVMSVAFLGVTH